MPTTPAGQTALIIVIGVVALAIVLACLAVRFKCKEWFASVHEDLANTYVPEILKKYPVQKENTTTERESAEGDSKEATTDGDGR